MKLIKVGDHDVELRKHHFSKQIRLSVKHAKVLVTLPHRYPYRVAEQFVKSKQKWINQQLKQSTPLRAPTKSERNQARAIAEQLVKSWAKQMEVKHNNVSIRNQTTRWGSCSTSGTLSFNWRLVNLPVELQNYLVVHELAHVVHPNHSQSFWRLVADYQPEYKTLRKQLKQIDFAEVEG